MSRGPGKGMKPSMNYNAKKFRENFEKAFSKKKTKSECVET